LTQVAFSTGRLAVAQSKLGLPATAIWAPSRSSSCASDLYSLNGGMIRVQLDRGGKIGQRAQPMSRLTGSIPYIVAGFLLAR
jgi:hypothetical protein